METEIKIKLLRDNPFPMPQMEWDVVPPHSSLELFHANKRLDETIVQMIAKQIGETREHIYNFCEWDELQVRKRKLRKSFERSNKIIKEHKASIFRFNEKISENVKEQELLVEEIQHVKDEVVHYTKIRDEMEKYVTEYSQRYEMFLESVTENAQEFNSIRDILNRYETLENCRKDCIELLQQEMDEASELRKEMVKIMEEKSSVLKKLDNSLVMLQVRQKQAKEQRMQWEYVLGRVKDMIISKSLESEILKNGCYDLYQEICKQRKIFPTIDREDIKNQLRFIQKYIIFYKDVIRLATSVKLDQVHILKSKLRKEKFNLMENILGEKTKSSNV